MTGFKALGLRARMSLPIIAIFFLAIGSTTLYSSYMTRETFKKMALEDARNLARGLADDVAKVLEGPLNHVETMASNFAALKSTGQLTRPAAGTMLTNFIEAHSELVGIWTVWEPNAFDGLDAQFVGKPGHDATGRYIPYFNRGSGVVKLEANVDYEKPGIGDYYLEPKLKKEATAIEPYAYPVNGVETLITTLAFPILIDGNFAGAVGIDIALQDLQKRLGGIKPYQTGFVSLISSKGVYVANPDAELISKNVEYGSEGGLIKNAISSRQIFISQNANAQGFLEVFAPITIGTSSSLWSLRVSLPLGIIMANVDKLIFMQIIGSALTLFGLIGIVLYLAKSISSPLYQIAQKLQITADGLVVRGDNLGGMSLQVSQSSTEQAAAVQETVSSMNEMVAMIGQTKKSTEDVLLLMERIDGRAGKGQKTMEQMAQSMESIHGSSMQLKAISKIIDEINLKTAFIDDMVFKTQLLAFNANIEAARAGEHGHGFSVVAEEVNKLATNSGAASDEIKNLLETSRNHIQDVLTSTESKVDDGRTVTRDAVETFNLIAGEVKIIMSRAQELASANKEQEAGVHQVLTAMTQIDATNQRSSVNAKEASEAADEIRESGSGLILIAQEARRLVVGTKVGGLTGRR